ncbi:MAG: hypothetical protein IKI75_08450 [Lachnospiraceae bacterium]|nr:hypothetical protein [Lachnospiraceae bacterium]
MAKTNSNIESTIEQMEELVRRSKGVFFSSTNISVDREELEMLIRQLKSQIPEEVERYRKIISNKEAIERSAKEEADRMLSQVQQQANEILSESEIMNRAQNQADDMINMAVEEANRIIEDAQFQGDQYMASAQKYLTDMLKSLQDMIFDCVDTTTRNTNKLLESLNGVGQTVQENLNELTAPAPVQAEPQEPAPKEEEVHSIFDNDNGIG